MRMLFILTALLSGTASASICSRTLTFVDGAVLSAAQLNNEFNAITNCANSLDNANLSVGANISPLKIDSSIALSGGALVRDLGTGGLSVNPDGSTLEINSNTLRVKDAGITAAKMATNSIATASIQNNAVTTAKIADAQITQAKLAAGVNTAILKEQLFTSSSTAWVAPSGVLHVVAIGCGAGGGGGAGNTTNGTGGGGGAGSISHTFEFTTVPGNTYTVEVGQPANGGVGGAGVGTDGTDGGFSDVIDGPFAVAYWFGGKGGKHGTASQGVGGAGDIAHTSGGAGNVSGSGSFDNLGGSPGTGISGGGGGGAGENAGSIFSGFNGSGANGGNSGGATGSSGSDATAFSCAGGGGGGAGTVTSGSGGKSGGGFVKLIWVGP